jgi:hypothetical protein
MPSEVVVFNLSVDYNHINDIVLLSWGHFVNQG